MDLIVCIIIYSSICVLYTFPHQHTYFDQIWNGGRGISLGDFRQFNNMNTTLTASNQRGKLDHQKP